jgi:hypothetical protein
MPKKSLFDGRVAGEQPHASDIAPGHQLEAVEFDFMKPSLDR